MSKPTLYAKLRFCPRCGLEGLQRDSYTLEHTGRNHKIEYICRVCGVGFRVGPSVRSIKALELMADDRKLRCHPRSHAGVKSEVRTVWEKQNPEPFWFKLWRFSRRLCGIPQDPMTHAKERDRRLREIQVEMTPEFFRALDLAIRARGTPRNIVEWAARLAHDVADLAD